MEKSMKDLPTEVVNEISGHLPTIEDKTHSIVDRKTRTLFQPPAILSKFLEFVAYGKQEHAEKIFTLREKNPQQLQELLLDRGAVTDYSGRTFTNISAYEYAYWAKDKHMCRMLESHMDKNTKAAMLKRCDAIEKNGLTFKQHGGEVKGSKHFDFTPLKTALKNYIDGYDNWKSNWNGVAMEAAWLEIGKAQREAPVHVANEYCRKDRSFEPTPQFIEDKLPRELIFSDYEMRGERACWFPLAISESSDIWEGVTLIGKNAALIQLTSFEAPPRAVAMSPSWRSWVLRCCAIDLAAITRLDEIRTADLTQSRKNLEPTEPGLDNNKCWL